MTHPARFGQPHATLARTAAHLQIALLRGSLRAGPGSMARVLGLVLGGIVGAVLAGAAFVGLAATRGRGSVPEDLAVVLFTAVFVLWIVLPLLTFAGDDLLDPARLALLPLTPADLMIVMGVGALIGVAPAATLLAALGLLPAVATGTRTARVALFAAPMLLALCVTASRCVAAALARLLRSRRGRDLGVLLTALFSGAVLLVNPAIQAAVGVDPAQAPLHEVAGVLRLTPLGLLLAVAVPIAVLLVGWERAVRSSLAISGPARAARRRSASLTLSRVRWLPSSQGRVGAVLSKDLR